MKTTQLIRNRLGLSQEVMAQYLGVAKSQLAMYEAGKRELPTFALVKLAEIDLFFEQKITTDEDSKFKKNQKLEVKALLAHQAKELEYKQIKEQRLLDAIQKKYNQNLQLNALALYLQKNKSVLADVLLQQSIKGIERSSLAKQAKQIIKLEGVKRQLEHLNTLKEK